MARGRRDDVVATSFCPSQQRRRYVLNQTPNDVSLERCQEVSVLRLQDIIKVRRDNVPLARLHDVSN